MDNGTWLGEVVVVKEINNRKYTEEISELSRLTYGIIFPVIVATGVFGNIVNLAVLTRPLLQSVPYIFAKWRSVSDLLALMSCIPFILQMRDSTKAWDSYWIAFYYSKLQIFVVNSLFGVSALYVTAFSVERYMFVSKPLKMHFDSRGKAKTLIAVIGISVASPFLYLPYCFTNVIDYGYNPETNSSQYTFHSNQATVHSPVFRFYTLFLQSVFRIGPTIAVAIFNVSIFVEYRKILKRRVQLRKTDSNEHQRREEKRLMLMLAGTSLTFFVCNSPAAVLIIAFKENLELNFGFQLFRAISNTLEVCNAALPVIIYVTVSADFRKTLVGFFSRVESNVTTTAT